MNLLSDLCSKSRALIKFHLPTLVLQAVSKYYAMQATFVALVSQVLFLVAWLHQVHQSAARGESIRISLMDIFGTRCLSKRTARRSGHTTCSTRLFFCLYLIIVTSIFRKTVYAQSSCTKMGSNQARSSPLGVRIRKGNAQQTADANLDACFIPLVFTMKAVP